MLPTGYEVHKRWGSISRNEDSGKLKILTCQITDRVKRKKWHHTYQDNLALLDDMIKSVAKRATDYSRRDENEYVFGYGERQLDSILVPVFWDIVGRRRQGLVLAQCPTERRRMKDPLRKGEKSKAHKGWVDYRVKQRETIYVLEIKFAPSDESLLGNYLSSKWNEARKQLMEIGSKQVGKLGGENSTVFKTAILFIPIFVKESERNLLGHKNTSYIEEQVNLKTLGQLKPKPDWIGCWLLPNDLQEEWQDDQEKYWWHSPAVLVLAKLFGKWEKKDSGSWAPVKD